VEQPNEVEENLCVSCQRKTTGAHHCKDCGQICHAIPPCAVPDHDHQEECEGFGTSVLCSLCDRKWKIATERKGAKRKQQVQADKMVEQSAKRFMAAKVGDTVMIPIPEVDRGRAEFRNVKGVVVSVEESGMYKLGTKHGLLNQLYSRNQFMPCINKFMSVEEVPKNENITLREVARKDSIGTWQGFFKCNCTKMCENSHCKCVQNKVKCNSRCHGSGTCKNKTD